MSNTQICGFGPSSSPWVSVSGFLRPDLNASRLPSGDHRGDDAPSLPRVSGSSFFSVRLVSTRFETTRPFSLSGVPLTHTAQRQSGEISMPRNSSAMITSSTVHLVSGAPAEALTAPAGAAAGVDVWARAREAAHNVATKAKAPTATCRIRSPSIEESAQYTARRGKAKASPYRRRRGQESLALPVSRRDLTGD